MCKLASWEWWHTQGTWTNQHQSGPNPNFTTRLLWNTSHFTSLTLNGSAIAASHLNYIDEMPPNHASRKQAREVERKSTPLTPSVVIDRWKHHMNRDKAVALTATSCMLEVHQWDETCSFKTVPTTFRNCLTSEKLLNRCNEPNYVCTRYSF